MALTVTMSVFAGFCDRFSFFFRSEGKRVWSLDFFPVHTKTQYTPLLARRPLGLPKRVFWCLEVLEYVYRAPCGGVR